MTVRVVGFDLVQHKQLSVSMQPVQLQNCTIQKQLHSEEMEVIIAGSSNVSTSPRKFAKVASTTEVNLIFIIRVHIIYTINLLYR